MANARDCLAAILYALGNSGKPRIVVGRRPEAALAAVRSERPVPNEEYGKQHVET